MTILFACVLTIPLKWSMLFQAVSRARRTLSSTDPIQVKPFADRSNAMRFVLHAVLSFSLLTAAVLIGGCAQRDGVPAADSGMRGDHDHTGSGTSEPALPPVLQIERDAADPEVFTIRVLPTIAGNVRLGIKGTRPHEWLTTPPATMKLQAGEAERAWRLRAPSGKGVKTAGGEMDDGDALFVTLVYTDDEGNVTMTVDEPLPVDGDGMDSSTSAITSTSVGTSADGRPVRSVVPPNAPPPRVEERSP
jgi:hypothetical protein